MADKITITIKLFAQYRDGRFKTQDRSIPQGTTPKEIMDELGISEHKLPLGVLMVNSKHESEEYILQDGDILALFPKVGGG